MPKILRIRIRSRCRLCNRLVQPGDKVRVFMGVHGTHKFECAVHPFPREPTIREPFVNQKLDRWIKPERKSSDAKLEEEFLSRAKQISDQICGSAPPSQTICQNCQQPFSGLYRVHVRFCKQEVRVYG